jgi:predicted dehydrogenase
MWSSSKPWTKAGNVKVTEETSFVGWDAADKMMKSDVDVVILATPPHFRPMHLKAAVEAGKHVFTEKPVAVDPVGVRSVLETAKLAKEKGLAIVAGTQRRYQANYVEIMKRVHSGDIGELVGGQCYWNWGQMFSNWRQEWDPAKSDMENQIRRWVFYTWLSGDHICEQHVHNIDVINWAYQTHPVEAIGVGGRQARTGEHTGNVYDHFAVEFKYLNGARVMSMCRQMDGTEAKVSERVVGAGGYADLDDSGRGIISGAKAYRYEATPPNPYEQEHIELIKSIREGKPINDGENVAISTMTGILGRMSAYTGRAIKWDWAMEKSQLDLRPAKYEFGPNPVDPVAIPGVTKLI